MTELETIWPRVRQVNRAIKAHYAAQLYSPAYDRCGRFGPDRYAQVWYLDCTTDMKVSPFGDGPWIGFTGNAEARELVAKLALYVRDGVAPAGVDLSVPEGAESVI